MTVDHVGMAVFYPDRVLPDFNSGKYAPGYYWHAIDAGVPLSGQPNRFAYFDPRLGVSYDVFGTGNTIVRGGWGAYRFVTQVNDVAAPLVTAQHVLAYNLPGQKNRNAFATQSTRIRTLHRSMRERIAERF